MLPSVAVFVHVLGFGSLGSSFVDQVVQDRSLLNENLIFLSIGRIRRKFVHEVSNLPFLAHIGDEAPVGVRIKARHVAHVWITVWISVGDFKQEKKVVTVG